MTSIDPRLSAGMSRQGDRRRDGLDRGDERLGWKAGFGSAAAMETIGTTAPIVGFLSHATRVASGATVPIAGLADPRLEPEVAVRLGRDVPPGANAEEILAAIDAVAPAIEVIDMGAADDLEEILAGNIFHRAVAVGPFREATGDDFAATRVTLAVDETPVHTGVDPTVALGPLAPILEGMTWQLPLAGDALRAGDVVITGSVVAPLQLAGGERVEVSLDGGASLTVEIARV